MGRPTKDITEKKTARTITILPSVWDEFQGLVKAKVPGASASSHTETLVKNEIARLKGEDPVAIIDEAELESQLTTLMNRVNSIRKVFKDAGATKRVLKLMRDYDLQEDHSNAEEVINQMLQDYGSTNEDTPVARSLEFNAAHSAMILPSDAFREAIDSYVKKKL